MPSRFLLLADVAEQLNISAAQAYALVRSGDLPAIKVGGRGQWRVEVSELEGYIQRMYDQTRAFVSQHPFGATDADAVGNVAAVGNVDVNGDVDLQADVRANT